MLRVFVLLGCYTFSVDSIVFTPLVAEHLQELEQWHQDSELARRYAGTKWPLQLWDILQKDPMRRCWVVSAGDEAIGYVDFEMHPEEHLAWIGLAVKAEKRGQGWGKRILQAFLKTPFAQKFTEIRAGIEPDNTASIHCFSSAGFVPLSTKPDEEGVIDYSYFPMTS